MGWAEEVSHVSGVRYNRVWLLNVDSVNAKLE